MRYIARRLAMAATVLFAGIATGVAQAAAPWPEKTVRLVVPFIAGGGTDIHARIVADELNKMFGQQFMVVNMPGGTAQVGYGHVAYKADNAVLPDLVGGRLEMFISPLAVALPFIEAQRIRPIAVTAKTRAASLPQVPTMDEAGLKGYEVTSWYGVLGPAGTPRDIVDRLNAALLKIVAMPAVREKFAQNGSEPTGTSVEEFRTIIEGNLRNFARIIEASGAKPLD